MRFRSLGSGSTGNATVVESGGLLPFRVLVDCGLGIRQLQHRLLRAGLQPEDINTIFITHEHGDHIGCAHAMALRYRIPVWMSKGTHAAIGSPDFDGLLRIARDGQSIDTGGLQITPFTVPHDAREPLQLTCTDGASKFGVLTDLGHSTAHVMDHLAGCNGVLLEFNHDADLLEQSSYPFFLKRRVGGQYGHLSNSAAAEIAGQLLHDRLVHVVAAHLSIQNNRTALVQDLLAKTLSRASTDIVVANPDEGCGWMQL